MNKHELALNHAMSAVILLQEMMMKKKLDPASVEEEDPIIEQTKDRKAVLAIAYHNMGVEQEFLRSYPAAILSYKKAVNFAEKHLGAEDGITTNLRNVYENARTELDLALAKKGKGKGKKGVKGKKGATGEFANLMTPRNDGGEQ